MPRKTHKIIVKRGRDTGARSEKSAKESAAKYRTKGKRLYKIKKDTIDHEYHESAERNFEPGSFKKERVAPGVIRVTGVERKKKKAPSKRAPNK